ncbi:MAG: DUF4158 domain-containing protein [Pseudomonadota bacterium]|nr:DUF4158 domain-containing protein [Pseudomonadota bacterium]
MRSDRWWNLQNGACWRRRTHQADEFVDPGQFAQAQALCGSRRQRPGQAQSALWVNSASAPTTSCQGRYPDLPPPHDLARYFHLDDSDQALIAKKRGVHNRFGLAMQRATVTYVHTSGRSPGLAPASARGTGIANQ